MFENGGRIGEEFKQSWGKLRLEAAEAAQWLEEELEGRLSVHARNVGEGSTIGATRRLVMEQLEQQRWKLLSKRAGVVSRPGGQALLELARQGEAD